MLNMLLLVSGKYPVLKPSEAETVLEYVVETVKVVMPVAIACLAIIIGIGLVPRIINAFIEDDPSSKPVKPGALDMLYKRRWAFKRRILTLSRLLEDDLSENDAICILNEKEFYEDELSFLDSVIDFHYDRKVGFLEGNKALVKRFLTYIKTKKKERQNP